MRGENQCAADEGINRSRVAGDNSWRRIKNEKGWGAAGWGPRKAEFKWHHGVDTINHRDNVASTLNRSLDNNLASLHGKKDHLNSTVEKLYTAFLPHDVFFKPFWKQILSLTIYQIQTLPVHEDGWSHRDVTHWFANTFFRPTDWFHGQNYMDIFACNKNTVFKGLTFGFHCVLTAIHFQFFCNHFWRPRLAKR